MKIIKNTTKRCEKEHCQHCFTGSEMDRDCAASLCAFYYNWRRNPLKYSLLTEVCRAQVLALKSVKVAVHTCDVLWRENLIKTQSYASLTTSCIVTLFNPIELWSIAMHYGGPLTNSNASWMLVVHRNF